MTEIIKRIMEMLKLSIKGRLWMSQTPTIAMNDNNPSSIEASGSTLSGG